MHLSFLGFLQWCFLRSPLIKVFIRFSDYFQNLFLQLYFCFTILMVAYFEKKQRNKLNRPKTISRPAPHNIQLCKAQLTHANAAYQLFTLYGDMF